MRQNTRETHNHQGQWADLAPHNLAPHDLVSQKLLTWSHGFVQNIANLCHEYRA